jgi:uncharacterized protein (DUF433 family)
LKVTASPITTHLPEWLDQELKRVFEATGERRSEGLRRVVLEWWAQQHFPAIEYRNGYSGRRAAVRGGPDVWEIVMVAQGYGDDLAGLQAHFDWLSPEQLRQALAYAQRFSLQTQRELEANDRAGRALQAESDATER